ncbi:MAG: GNAT family N-acetyltransferase [Burkholderiales bacterium]|nr:GNAT family N-acetyltransferase [Burkholderiales bacterium]
MTRDIRWTVLPLLAGLEARQSDWHELNARLHADHPLTSFAFMHALARHFSDGNDFLALCEQDGQLRAAIPLTKQSLRWRSYLPAQSQMSALMIDDLGLLPGLMAALPGPTLWMDWYAVDPLYSPPLSASPLRVERQPHVTTLNIDLSGSFETYWQSRSRSLRDDLKNKWNRLKKDGRGHELRISNTADDVSAALTRYAALEGQSWKAEQGTAVALGTVQGDFYTDVLQRFAATGQATVYEMLIDGELAASEIVLRGGRMSVLLKTTHAETFQRYAPGYLLDQLVIEAEFTSRASDVIEFYTSANDAKLRWGTGQRTIEHARLYRHALTASVVRLWRRAKQK